MTLDLDELERLEREATEERAQGRSTGQAAVRWYQAGTAALPALLAELRALRAVAEAAGKFTHALGFVYWVIASESTTPPATLEAACDANAELDEALDAWRGSR